MNFHPHYRLPGFTFLIFLLAGCSGQKKNPNPVDDARKGSTTAPVSVPKIFETGPVSSGDVKETILEVSPADLEYPGTGEIALYEGKPFTGQAATFYSNGQQATQIDFVNGKRHGIESRWFEDGAKKFEGRFQENTLVGVFEEWHQNGQRKSQAVWQGGKRESVTEWDENGNLLRQ
jgi:antitoxin component YwqK of YwqJK toxin-antitoxin module